MFLSLPEHRAEFETAGIPVAGTLDELLAQGDVVVDCTPKGVAATNRERRPALQAYLGRQRGIPHAVANPVGGTVTVGFDDMVGSEARYLRAASAEGSSMMHSIV